MIKRRRKWRQQERDKAMKNVFEAQMHMRMRRQSLKQAEIRETQEVEVDCVTLDLGSARSRDSRRSGPDDDLVLKVRQPLTQDASFRLEKLGGLNMALAVPVFVYRVFLADRQQYSGDATEGSAGVYRVPRLLHNSRMKLPSRPAHCYV
ncbi:uncharacterized protein PITG_12532 [Phytophthora infestans T30-4]|uniref:Uncharacterized protein n=1 Tax=Phytophthora infestans (strain T30-4) TaxID=403677 RepID=D0NKR9_PHYIT|nr:uncharacterized protein PITG_12532 [Phytophthora infestans T30-4]EEY60205.1 conserved hypothetical protein [Phytophthora infestans T30-4]|eukprot:XP_002900412.1 conserved hypothetical protein [Phytophthora infestans T30-4]